MSEDVLRSRVPSAYSSLVIHTRVGNVRDKGLSVRYEGALGTRYGESLRDSGPVCPSVVRDPPS